MVAVSTSGFTEAATHSAAANRILLRNLKQITEEDVRRWFVRTQLSIPRCQYIGAVVIYHRPERAEHLVRLEDPGPTFLIPPIDSLRSLRELWEQIPDQLITSPLTAQIPSDGSKRPLTVTVSPEAPGASVVIGEETYPFVEVQLLFVLWMESLDPAVTDARQYGDNEGVLAQMSSYVFLIPDGFWSLQVTETPLEGEKYLYRYDAAGREKRAEEEEPGA